MPSESNHRIVIVGGGFGGLLATEKLSRADVDITLIDKRNFHLFQPLLYQVATGGISPADISSPLRAVLKRQKNVRVWQAEATDIDAEKREVVLRDGRVPYDTLIVSTGARHHYFGNHEWETHAPGLKTVEDALNIRRRVLLAFEKAEREPDIEERAALLRFVIVGGGPTGAELAGAIGELANGTLVEDFRNIDPGSTEITLIEGTDRILPTFPPPLSEKARQFLEKLGVTVKTNAQVTDVTSETVVFEQAGRSERIDARTVLWAAGVKGSAIGRVLEERLGATLDSGGRVEVGPDLTIPGHPEVFVIGDLASFVQDGKPLPGVAPVAMQQGSFAAKTIRRRLAGRPTPPFRYKNRGNLAVIGRAAAVCDLGRFRFSGRPAWLLWLFIHIAYLVEYDNRIKVLTQWAADYFTRKRGARLITGKDPQPMIKQES
ncbi:MAG: NAD(P)/FAD-dependent oxidoreductase [bacterium]|nr:NAD(P)/FAD-dependent oxidoreductase [bacterium]